LAPATAVFVVVWFSFLFILGLRAIRGAATLPGQPHPLLFVGPMFGLGIIFVLAGFIPEAGKAARLLEDLLVAQRMPLSERT
jgi:hypothetical protein